MLRELLSRRTATSREFINPNGSLSVEISASPIHYKDQSGKWSEIVNDLVRSNAHGFAYKNQANSHEIFFAENNTAGPLTRFEIDGDHWIEMSPSEVFEGSAKVDGNAITYTGIMPDTDLKYAVLSDKIKESIVLTRYTGNHQFTFKLKTNGIAYRKDEANNYSFTDAGTNKRLFTILKPFAEDSAGRINDDLTSEIRKGETGDEHIVTISDSWLRSASFPVIIDPSVNIDIRPTGTLSRDTYISSLNPTTPYNTSLYLNAGAHATLGTTRSFIKFENLPGLRPFAKITNAYLGVYMYLAVGADSTVINAHQITSGWEPETTTWNSQPAYRSTPESSIASSANNEWQFDITGLVRRWYSLDQDFYGAAVNNGIMLKAADESTPRRAFFSGDYTADSQPRLHITYEVDPIGLEDFWQYDDNNVNVYNGNFVLSEADVTLPGRGVPIRVARTYNSRVISPAAYPYGYGWTYDAARHINYMDGGAITYTTDSGNKYVFVKNANGIYESPAGTGVTLTVESGVYVITEPSGVKYSFNNNGRLYNTADLSGNITAITFHTDGTIHTITDPSGRSAAFSYTGGKLAGITGAQIPAVEYSYQDADLTSAVIKDSSGNILWQETYGYGSDHNMTSITDGEGNVTTISYSGDKVQSITRQLTIDGIAENLVTSYSYQVNADTVVTQVTDPKGSVTRYTCNKFGNATEIIKDYGAGNLNLTSEFSRNDEMALTGETYPRQVSDGQDGYEYSYNNLNDPRYPSSKYDVTRVKTPNNLYTNYQYNQIEISGSITSYKSDIVQIMDRSGYTQKYIYDGVRSVSSTYNLFVYAQATDYNSYGDVVKETINFGVQGNLLPNTSFERWSGGAAHPMVQGKQRGDDQRGYGE